MLWHPQKQPDFPRCHACAHRGMLVPSTFMCVISVSRAGEWGSKHVESFIVQDVCLCRELCRRGLPLIILCAHACC